MRFKIRRLADILVYLAASAAAFGFRIFSHVYDRHHSGGRPAR
jgi:hypothetical protein